MATTLLSPIENLLAEQRTAIADEWLAHVIRVWSERYDDLISENDLREHANRLLDELAGVFASCRHDAPPELLADGPLTANARELSARHAKAGFKPADTAQYVLALKNVLTNRLISELSQSPESLRACLMALEYVLTRLSLLTFECYVEVREKVITQQALSLMELSTPVIRMWDQVLMVPLVGVIDTRRARQFTERLLEGIARYEATVTIIDVTGVPVFDTGVARHIMKTVDAAQLLGTRVIMTGISPEGAQTLTKLGVDFGGVVSRATLRAGVAEALKMVGQRVGAVNRALA
jgi:rsbT co-antagonist protein RsbR